LTLIGDVAHLISPFAGVGINISIEDALRPGIGAILCKHELLTADVAIISNTLSEVTMEYEEMFPRAKENAKKFTVGLLVETRCRQGR
jgi:hypothetical protein